MITDLRNKKRKIEIIFEQTNIHGENFSLDEHIDSILQDIKIVIEQRRIYPEVKTEIIIT